MNAMAPLATALDETWHNRLGRAPGRVGEQEMWSDEEWRAACDQVAAELLDTAGVVAPPVDALEVTRRLEIGLAWDASQSGRARLQRLDGRPAVFLRPDDRPERLQWAAAHELGETVAWKVCEILQISPEELLPRSREQLANQLAQRLLLPTAWFRRAHAETGGELFALKARFATASHELIAWRWLDLPSPAVVSVFDHGQLSRRRCNFAPRAPALQTLEQDCRNRAHETGATASGEAALGRVRAWAVHEPGWRREIVRWDVADAD